MNAHTVRSMATLAVVSALVAGCTWVKIPDDARALPLLDASEVVQCKRLGSITTNVAWKVAGIERGENKVRVELDNLARERALTMGGNAVVRESIHEGTGDYTAWMCP